MPVRSREFPQISLKFSVDGISGCEPDWQRKNPETNVRLRRAGNLLSNNCARACVARSTAPAFPSVIAVKNPLSAQARRTNTRAVNVVVDFVVWERMCRHSKDKSDYKNEQRCKAE